MSTTANSANQGQLLPPDLPPGALTREGPTADHRNLRKASKSVNKSVIPRIILILMCALFVLPFYWMVSIGLKSNTELLSYPPTLWPHAPQWGNFQKAIDTVPF